MNDHHAFLSDIERVVLPYKDGSVDEAWVAYLDVESKCGGSDLIKTMPQYEDIYYDTEFLFDPIRTVTTNDISSQIIELRREIKQGEAV